MTQIPGSASEKQLTASPGATQLKHSDFRLVYDQSVPAVIAINDSGNVTYANQAAIRLTGLSEDLLTGSFFLDLFHDASEERSNELRLLEPEPVVDGMFINGKGQEFQISSQVYRDSCDERLTYLFIHPVPEPKNSQEAVQFSEGHFKALTNHNSLPIWQVDKNCNMTFVNDTWRQWTGVTAIQIREEDWSDHIHPEDRGQIVQTFNNLLEQRSPVQLKYRFRNDVLGEYRWILDNAQPVFNPEFDGYIGTMTDIDEQEQARLAIQLLMKKKDEFMAIASHELKTPITSMKASLQILERISAETFNPQKAKMFIGMANKQVNRLTSIVGDLLDVTKIQAGRMELNKARYDFHESLLECVRDTQQYETRHQIILHDHSEVFVQADQARVEQVITNLLSNAIKYSPGKASVEVILTVTHHELKCTVTDAGIGIPTDKQAYIFDRFFRVHDSSQTFAGLGLGLYISSEIIKQHQGKIGLISEEGKGSSFWFTLPLGGE